MCLIISFVDFEVPLPMNKWGIFARIIEFQVGGEHYRGFQSYMKEGGLSVILNKHKIREIQSTHFAGGLILVVKAANN